MGHLNPMGVFREASGFNRSPNKSVPAIKAHKMHKKAPKTIGKIPKSNPPRNRKTFLVTSLLTPTFIHSGYFYSATSSSLLLRGPPDTARMLCWNFTPKRHRQL